jgi:hypothetical protein
VPSLKTTCITTTNITTTIKIITTTNIITTIKIITTTNIITTIKIKLSQLFKIQHLFNKNILNNF